jgi:hypothetical protein
LVIGAGIVGGLFNVAFWMVMLATQKWLSRTGRIPAQTSKFFYLWDFHSSGWGDLFGVTLINIGVSAVIAQVWNPGAWPYVLGACLFGIAVTVAFQYSCTRPSHKPDWGYPVAGKTSIGGWIHLVYFGFQYTFGFFGLLLVINTGFAGGFGSIVLPFFIGIGGAVIYYLSIALDFKQGHFAPASEQKACSDE